MSVIKLTSNYANVDHQAACRALRDFVATPQSRKRDWLRLLLLAIGIGLAFGAIVRYSGIDFGGLYLPFILLCLALIIVLRFWRQTRKQRLAAYNAAEKSEQIVLDSEGYCVEHQGETTKVSWSNVLGLTTTDDALLIVLSPKHYYPIETRAFEDIEQMAATAAKIQEWVEAAKNN